MNRLCVFCIFVLFASYMSFGQSVFVYDNAEEIMDLTGGMDEDSSEDRTLVLEWNADIAEGEGWDIYVSQNDMEYQFLTRLAPDVSQFTWNKNTLQVHQRFRNGPEFGNTYQFQVIRIHRPIGADDIIEQTSSVEYQEIGNHQMLPQPFVPDIEADNICFHYNGLISNIPNPLSDFVYPSDEQGILLGWNFDQSEKEIKYVHVYVQVDAEINRDTGKHDYRFLGSLSGKSKYYLWSKDSPFKVSQEFKNGPSEGHVYRFRIYLIYEDNTKQIKYSPPVAPYRSEFRRIEIPGLPEDAIPLDMVWIKPGTFMMGVGEDYRFHNSYANNQQAITLTKGFYISQCETTQAQWQAIMNHNPAYFQESGLNAPVENVSWVDIADYIQQLNNTLQNQVNGEFRFPSDAEWEYSARAGTDTEFYWGTFSDLYKMHFFEWFLENSNRKTHVVGEKYPNNWFLFDTCGNVQEWVEDYPYDVGDEPFVDPRRNAYQTEFQKTWRMKRLGNISGVGLHTRITSAWPENKHNKTGHLAWFHVYGFRLVLDTNGENPYF